MRVPRGFPLCLSLLIALAPVRGASAVEPYAVPVVLSLTGQAALAGAAIHQALDLLQKVVNDGGGIAGRPLQFEFTDDGGNAAAAVQIFTQLIARNAPIVIGPMLVATCRAVAPLVTAGPVQFCLSPGGATPKGGYSFVAGYSTPDAFKTAVRYFRERGFRRAAILAPTDATGQDGERSVDQALADSESHDIAVVAREHFSATDISVAAQLTRIKAANPDVLFAWETGAPIATVLHGMVDAGLDIPTFTSHGNMLYSVMAQYGDLTPKAGLYFAGPQLLARDILRGPSRTAADAFLASYAAAGLRPDFSMAPSWDAAVVVVNALRHVGPNPSAEKIRDDIENIRGLAGAAATFDFRDGSQRGISAATILVARWDAQTHSFVAVSRPGGTPLAR